jgi:hypothetical protein
MNSASPTPFLEGKLSLFDTSAMEVITQINVFNPTSSESRRNRDTSHLSRFPPLPKFHLIVNEPVDLTRGVGFCSPA